MKMVMIAYGWALDGELTETLAALGVRSFTKVARAQGRGAHSEPHLDSDVWPGTNGLLLVAADDKLAARVLQAVREMRARAGQEGLKAFLLPVEEVTG